MSGVPWSPFREVLHYDPRLGRVGTWRLADDPFHGELEVRLRLALGPEVTTQVFLRYSGTAEKHPARVHVRQLDESTFCLESAILHRAVPRVELQLNDAPAEAASVLRSL